MKDGEASGGMCSIEVADDLIAPSNQVQPDVFRVIDAIWGDEGCELLRTYAGAL